jgi:hypothetical protein
MERGEVREFAERHRHEAVGVLLLLIAAIRRDLEAHSSGRRWNRTEFESVDLRSSEC